MKARLLPLLGLLLASACKEPASSPPPPASPAAARPTAASAPRFLAGPPDGKLHVYFFDVGRGDAALIVSPEGRTVLVDAGPAAAVEHVTNRLPELLASRLDLVVLTHPAADHYGGMPAVQKLVDPRRLLEPQLPRTPTEYDSLLTALGSRGVEIFSPAPNPSQPQEPLRLPLGGGAELTVLWPRAPTEPLLTVAGTGADHQAEHEANSMVLRLTHGETSVLFAGDARAETEAALVKVRGQGLRSTLLKVSGHGAEGATSLEWLQEVRPRAALISTDAKNPPAKATLDRLKLAGTRVFRTDQHGEVHVVSDGKRLVVTSQRLVPEEKTPGPQAFEPLGSDVALAPLVAPQPVAKVVPAKGAAAKTSEPDLSRFKQVVDVNPQDAARPPDKGGQTGKGTTKGGSIRYVGSRNGEVFHVPDCPYALKILPGNLITYSTREAADKAGRRPHKSCTP